MLFNVDHQALEDVELVEEVAVPPEATGRQYGFSGETLDFLTHVGLPQAEEYELGFFLPQDFNSAFIWDATAKAADGWETPDELKTVVKIGNFPINPIVIAPDTGTVYQYTEGVNLVIPIHQDISSLIKTAQSWLDFITSFSADDEDPDSADARRRQEVEALMAYIREVDPLPFANQYSEWNELFDNLQGGMYT
ncbi:SUKH-4 family immunity protein [Streptomyces sp. cg35]|uniref:SUKH-4 family immunity protein n=1 Tax=Streptomyces sp. cg35 TaxID=3421650 RepID=UPI003D16BF02